MSKAKRHPNLRAIWEDLYRIRIPQKYTYSEEALKYRGMPTTGDENVDKTLREEMIVVYETIDRMFEFYRLGAPIAIVDVNDTKKIYDAIQAHLGAWLDYMQRAINIYQVPFDDLLDLDAFAGVVYEEAKYIFDTKSIQSLNTAWNELGIDLNPSTFFKSKGGVRFFHLLKSDEERALERGERRRRVIPERSGYGTDLMRLADRFDQRHRNSASLNLRFGNDRWTKKDDPL